MTTKTQGKNDYPAYVSVFPKIGMPGFIKETKKAGNEEEHYHVLSIILSEGGSADEEFGYMVFLGERHLGKATFAKILKVVPKGDICHLHSGLSLEAELLGGGKNLIKGFMAIQIAHKLLEDVITCANIKADNPELNVFDFGQELLMKRVKLLN